MELDQPTEALPAPVQGRDEIVIDALPEDVWPLIADSRLLPKWGPPVVSVEVAGPPDRPEGVGSRRRVDAKFGRRIGYYVERRIQHVPERRMAFLIEEETFGLFRFLERVGALMEIEPAGPNQTRVTWSFFHQSRGLLGAVMNRAVILRQQRANRLRALASLKAFAEEGRVRPVP